MIRKLIFSFLTLAAITSCAEYKFVSDYDPVIDQGISQFAEEFNTHIKNMGDLAGTPDGTYEANLKTYNSLESKLDVMIARVSIASEGKACKLEQSAHDRIKDLMKDNMPAELASSDNAIAGNANGCNEKLLVLVKDQLSLVRQIHKTTDKCGDKNLSCLRPTTSGTALSIANQSINAVSVVEAAKKKSGKKS